MAFGTQDDTDEVMNEINMTPLVDVMLVLLIIFIITVPVMKHTVSIDLPNAANQVQDAKPETILNTFQNSADRQARLEATTTVASPAAASAASARSITR